MENATKALLMAAEIIIGVLILSLIVYLFINFGTASAEVSNKIDETVLQEFNTKYSKYKGIENISIHDIVSLANLARENNEYYELDDSYRGEDSSYYIAIYLKDEGYIEGDSQEELTQLIKKKMEKNSALEKYMCTDVKYSNTSGRVKQVDFEKKE